jgi:diguanylate cyclase (GGDEF)-like protein/putative nucleotidyltransferase with HDIG domain
MTSGSLPTFRVKAFVSLVVLVALPVFFAALHDVVHHSDGYQWILNFLILTALTLITVPIFVILPSVSTLISIGDAFVMSICMLCGTSAAIVANTLYVTHLTLSIRRKHNVPFHRVVFNIATAVLNAGLYGLVYHFLKRTDSNSLEYIILPAFGLAVAFFVSNSLFVATAIALSANQSILRIWRENYRLSLDFLVSACAAAVIVLFSQKHALAPLLAAPFVGAVWGINKINRAKAIESENHLRDQEQLYLRTVESLALAVDAKDQTTYGHIRRVRAYALGLAKLCGITNSDELKAIETGSLLHDIGKLAIDDYLLNKPGRLSKQEFEKMKLHAAAGNEILQEVRFPFPVAQYVRCHHEQWDGLGYPDGLKGEQIPLGARILTIADAFDAIRSSRPYKVSFGVQDSIELLRAQAGKRFDPHLVDHFTTHIDELVAAAEQAAKNAPELAFRKYFERVDRAISTADSANSHPSSASTPSSELMEMYEFCTSLGRHLDLPDFLHILARRLCHLLPFSTCAVYLDNGDDTLIAAHVSGKHSEWLRNLRVGMGKGISGWVAAYRRPMINTSPALEFQEVSGDFSSLADTMIVPLVAEGECMGTISLYADAPTVYTASHLNSLQTLASIVAPTIAEIRGRKPLMENKGMIDPVTQTHRAMYLSVSGSQLISSAEQSQSPLSLLCVDIKDYQQLVSLYGTHTGDAILRKAANTLKTELRETDILVRYGHQGFAALLPGVRKEKALRCAQRLQQQIRAGAVNSITGHSIPIDCQAGVASYPGDGSTTFALLQSAQRAMLDQAHVTGSADEEPAANIIEFPPRA